MGKTSFEFWVSRDKERGQKGKPVDAMNVLHNTSVAIRIWARRRCVHRKEANLLLLLL